MADGVQVEPLDKLRIQTEQDGRKRSVAALHIGWAVNRTFARYYSPIIEESASATSLILAQESWLERMDMFKQDLMFLLKLPHNRFWSQVVHHEDTHEALNSYLLNAPRPYDLNLVNFTREMKSKQGEIHRFVFLVYLRMATYKESKACHITPAAFGGLIYDYFLFDIPKMMDLCSLFGSNSRKFLQKMVSNVFATQTKYMNDLQVSIVEIEKVYMTILQRFGLTSKDFDEESGRAVKLTGHPLRQPLQLTSAHFLDVFLYFVDTCFTLFSFLDVYPAACRAFFLHKFPVKIASFYATIVPFLIEELDARRLHPEIKTRFEDILSLLGLARKSLLKTFRQIVESCCFQPLLEKDTVLDSGTSIDDYFDVMTSILSEKSFLVDYERQFAFTEDVDLFVQTGLFLDNNRVAYLTDGINMLTSDCGNGLLEDKTIVTDDKKISVSVPRAVTSADEGGACAAPVLTGVELASLVSQVKELLPEYEDSFIENCLEYYKYETDVVINSILENLLPPHLQTPDTHSTGQDANKSTVSQPTNGQLNGSANDFEGYSRMHKGKWSHRLRETKGAKIDENLKEVTLMLSSKIDADEQDLYDDEYDDTYDEQMISVNESVTWDEMLDRRPFVTPNVLRGSGGQSRAQEETYFNEEETVEEPVSAPRDEFVANPAIERERAEQRRRSLYQHRDVRGRPKGQGQDAQTTRNRDNKEKNKTFHGNHNRRAMADRKRRV